MPSLLIEAELPDAHHLSRRGRVLLTFKVDAPEDGPHPHQKRHGREGLRNIIVAAEAEAHGKVVLGIARGEHDDGHGADLAKLSTDRKPVRARHHHIQDHKLRRLFPKAREQQIAGGKILHRKAVAQKKGSDHLTDIVIVIGNINDFRVSHKNHPLFLLWWVRFFFILSSVKRKSKQGLCRSLYAVFRIIFVNFASVSRRLPPSPSAMIQPQRTKSRDSKRRQLQ